MWSHKKVLIKIANNNTVQVLWGDFDCVTGARCDSNREQTRSGYWRFIAFNTKINSAVLWDHSMTDIKGVPRLVLRCMAATTPDILSRRTTLKVLLDSVAHRCANVFQHVLLTLQPDKKVCRPTKGGVRQVGGLGKSNRAANRLWPLLIVCWFG